MKIQFQGKITVSDFRKALYLNMSPIIFWGTILIVGFLTLAFGYLYLFARDDEFVRSLSWEPLVMLFIIGGPLWLPILQASRSTQKGSFYSNLVRGELTDTEVFVDNGLSKGTLLWSAYTHYKKAKDIVVLYQGKFGASIFTRKLFSSESDWQQFLNLVASKLSVKQSK